MSWSLYKKTNEEGGIFDFSGEKLEPLTFTNKKTQEDVVNEILESIKKGNKIIFVEGVCGSGKSAIALNLAKHFKKSSIVVPIKSLQEQYEIDYTKKMYILKDDKTPLKISIIKGRNNFPCSYDILAQADNPLIPCTIEIREKNTQQLLNFVQQNPGAEVEEFSSATDIRRMNIAPACPYWAPIMSSDVNPKSLGEFKKIKYKSVAGEYALFQRKKGCPYYDQYENYATSDVLIFNLTKYLIESEMGRKPATDIEIIDECDEFLDSFANEKKININRLTSAIQNLNPVEPDKKSAVKELLNLLNEYLFDPKNNTECEKVIKTPFHKIINLILKNPNLAEDEELNYYNTAVEISRNFDKIINETYLSVERFKKEESKDTTLFGKNFAKDETVYVTLVSINLAEKFKELLEQNKTFVLMSGTLHSSDVLRDIFGLTDFKIIKAETKFPGEIKKHRTGIEKNCSYANFQNGSINRNTYLKILDLCLGNAKKPSLIHVNAFSDLPNQEEYERLKLENLITQDKLKEMQLNAAQEIKDFKTKRKQTLFTTKCSRGIDFPGEICNSIIMTRYPYPNISSLFWKILKKEQPKKFMEFYMDKARRELFQKVARGVRFKGDSVSLLSPDIRVLNQQFP